MNLLSMIEATIANDLPCSSSLEDPELPSSHELLLFPFAAKLLVGLLTEFLPLLLPDISVLPLSSMAGIFTTKRQQAMKLNRFGLTG